MSPSLADVLAWEVRVSVPAALAWMYLVIFGSLLLGRYLRDVQDSRRFRRIAESVRAERMEP